ncbi:MAG: glycosyltransferase family 1 protein, partial [Chloroflexi bacterium]
LCAPDDVTGFSAYIIKLLRDEALRQQMGQAAREHVEAHFSARGNMHQFTNALERLLEQ